MKKEKLTPRQMEKRMNANKKILKYGCLPIFALFFIIVIIGVIAGDSEPTTEELSKTYQEEFFNASNENEFNEALNNMINLKDSVANDSIKNELSRIIDTKDDQLELSKAFWKLEKVNESFSVYDGRHINLAMYVKDNLNDPGSFEHVKTDWGYHKEDSNKIVIYMEFRGKNAFGALVKNNVTAIADLEGNLLEIVN
jgi:hypothetical protein